MICRNRDATFCTLTLENSAWTSDDWLGRHAFRGVGDHQAFWSSPKYTACRLDLLVGLIRSTELSMSSWLSLLCLVFPCVDIAGGLSLYQSHFSYGTLFY